MGMSVAALVQGLSGSMVVAAVVVDHAPSSVVTTRT